MASPGTGFWSSRREPTKRTTSNDIPTSRSDTDRICQRPDVGGSTDGRIFEQPSDPPSSSRSMRFRALLDSPNVDLGESNHSTASDWLINAGDATEKLKALAWSGVPPDIRPQTWKILLVSQTNAPAEGEGADASNRATSQRIGSAAMPRWPASGKSTWTLSLSTSV